MALQRRQFLGAVRKEFSQVKSDVWKLVVTQDTFGLRDVKPFSANTLWKHQTLDQQADNFKQWFKQELRQTLLRTDPNTKLPWIAPYVGNAYVRGLERSYSDTHRLKRSMRPEWYRAQAQQFIRMSLSSPKGQGKQRLVINRAFDQLKGVTDSIQQNTSRVIAEGLAGRVRPQVLAQRLAWAIQGIHVPKRPKKSVVVNARRGTDARSSSIANTELTFAHAEGQLDALAEMGLDDVEILAEWVNGDNPCAECEEYEGTIWALEDAYGMIPFHPNCQCAWAAVDDEGDDITTEWFV